MTERNESTRRRASPPSRMPPNSLFYECLVPVLFVVLGLATLVIVLIAVGILLGIVPYQ